MSLRQQLLYALVTFLLLSFINVVCYILINKYENAGYNNFYGFESNFLLPLLYTVFLFWGFRYVKPMRRKWVIAYPGFFVVIKLILIFTRGHNVAVADGLLTFTEGFSNLFSIILFHMAKGGYYNNTTEILTITAGMFLYQVIVLWLARMIVDRVLSKQKIPLQNRAGS